MGALLIGIGCLLGIPLSAVAISYHLMWQKKKAGDPCSFGHSWGPWEDLTGTLELRADDGQVLISKFKRYSQATCRNCPAGRIYTHHDFPNLT